MLTSSERDGSVDTLCQCENPDHRGLAPFTRYCRVAELEGWHWVNGLLYCPVCVCDDLDRGFLEKLNDPKS